MTPPLSGPDAAILELLRAGRSFDEVCEIGRYRKAWRPSDVRRVEIEWLPVKSKGKPRGKPPLPGERRGRGQQPIPHGTESGYILERKRRLPYCEDCRTAATDAQRARRNRSA